MKSSPCEQSTENGGIVESVTEEARASERGVAAAAHGIDLCQLDTTERVKNVISFEEEELTNEQLAEKAMRAALNGF
ncbi:MAG: hypothetical protein R3B71_04310 [Candidatus Gracilibacteria bacterium]|nr:hypothetical protein [Candidatus Peregrinibacteria bacterium]